MKLYYCWSTNGGDHHDCHKAHQALVDAGHNPELVKARGQEHLPRFLQFKVRREVHALTGSFFVPVLVLDDGTAITKPDDIVAWAKANPACKSAPGTSCEMEPATRRPPTRHATPIFDAVESAARHPADGSRHRSAGVADHARG